MKQTTLPFNPEEIKPSKPKLDDKGYPTEASPEQMAVLHDKVMTNRYISGANKFGEYPKPKTTMQLRRKAHQQKTNKVSEADKWSGPSHRGPSYDHSARTLQQEQDLGDKMWLEKQKEENKSPLPVWMGDKYKSDLRSPNQKKFDAWAEKKKTVYDEKKYNINQRLKNVRGPHIAELIYKGMSPQEKGSHNAEQRHKKLDNPFGPSSVGSRPFPEDAFTLSTNQGPRTAKGIIKAFAQPVRKETNGLSEDFVIQKLKEKSIF